MRQVFHHIDRSQRMSRKVRFVSPATPRPGPSQAEYHDGISPHWGEMIDNLRNPFVQWKRTENLVAPSLSPILVFILRHILVARTMLRGSLGPASRFRIACVEFARAAIRLLRPILLGLEGTIDGKVCRRMGN